MLRLQRCHWLRTCGSGYVRTALLGVVCGLLSGCIGGPEDRINEAVSLAADLQISRQMVLTRAPQYARSELQKLLEQQLKLRALTCAHGYSPDWWTPTEKIGVVLTDRACFAQHDREIAQWLRIRHVGFVLAAGPLSEVPKGPIPIVSADSEITAVEYARNAGVVVLSLRDRIQAMDLNDGRTLLKEPQLPHLGRTYPSPNGRLLVLRQSGEAAQVRSIETGETFLELRGLRFLQWLNDRFAIYGTRAPTMFLIDFQSGQMLEVPALGDELLWAAPAPGTTDEFILSYFGSIVRVKLRLDETVPRLQVVKESTTDFHANQIETSGLTLDGAWHFQISGGPGLLLTSPNTFQQERIEFLPAQMVLGFAIGADRLLLQGFSPSYSGAGTLNLVFSINDRTVAIVNNEPYATRRLAFSPSVNKVAHIDGSRLIHLEQLETQHAQPLSSFLAKAVDAANQAKLAAAAKAMMEQPAPNAATGATGARVEPPLAALAVNADIEGIGVYEGNNAYGPDRKRQTGYMRVQVKARSRPLVLVLSSYDPVRWTLDVAPGARLSAVLVFSYYPSTVIGAGSARVLMLGQRSAYKRDSPEYQALDAEVARQIGKHIGIFQGRYNGGTFSVGS